MKNDSTTTFLNFVLAALVILCVMFALLSIWHQRDLRKLQAQLQVETQRYQVTATRAQQLLQDTVAFNATAKNPELDQIIRAAETPATPAK
jgi:hypothetical protein